MSSDDEKEFRLRPRKPPVPGQQRDARAWSLAFKRIMHYARMSRRGGTPKASTKPQRAVRARFQRCAVRVTYTRNAIQGQWRAHGRYLARESATYENDPKAVGFDQTRPGIDVADRLGQWQAAQDKLLWKFIISPEFGERIDLEQLTRDVMATMAHDLGTKLQWTAVAHHNTEHPHVHVALRGIQDDGRLLQLERRYLKEGIRATAEDYCTRQLGYRTELDAVEAERQEVHEKRFTSLDRSILKQTKETSDGTWLYVRCHDLRQLSTLEGRVLVHGEDEISGRNYLMLEGTDAKVHLIDHTPEIDVARSHGGLRVNTFIRLGKLFVDGRPMVEIDEMGSSESILKNGSHLQATAQQLINRGIIPTEDGWGSWLGRYQAALRETALRLVQERAELARQHQRQRGRDRSRGR